MEIDFFFTLRKNKIFEREKTAFYPKLEIFELLSQKIEKKFWQKKYFSEFF